MERKAHLKMLRISWNSARESLTGDLKLAMHNYGVAKAAEGREQRLKKAAQAAYQSLTWCNTDEQIPHAVWHLEQALALYTDTTETKEDDNQ